MYPACVDAKFEKDKLRDGPTDKGLINVRFTTASLMQQPA